MTADETSPDQGKNAAESIDWEQLARDRIATDLECHFEEVVESRFRSLIEAIENGEDSREAFFSLVSGLDEFADNVAYDIRTVGDFSSDDTRCRAYTVSSRVRPSVMRIIEDDRADRPAWCSREKRLAVSHEHLEETKQLLESIE